MCEKVGRVNSDPKPSWGCAGEICADPPVTCLAVKLDIQGICVID